VRGSHFVNCFICEYLVSKQENFLYKDISVALGEKYINHVNYTLLNDLFSNKLKAVHLIVSVV
jgi:hypothetical protein